VDRSAAPPFFLWVPSCNLSSNSALLHSHDVPPYHPKRHIILNFTRQRTTSNIILQLSPLSSWCTMKTNSIMGERI
jgi:hypothetical protein